MYVAFDIVDIVDLIIAITVIIIASLVLYYLVVINKKLDAKTKQNQDFTNVGYILDYKDFPKIVCKRKNEKGEFVVVKEMVVDVNKWYNDFEIVVKKEEKK